VIRTIHASCVAVGGRGLLILGPSGAGKSGLALHLMALGADLVADDRTELFTEGEAVVARCSDALRGLIEARGIGILHAPSVGTARLVLVADLSQIETERLPPRRNMDILGTTVDLVLGSLHAHFAYGLLCHLTNGRSA